MESIVRSIDLLWQDLRFGVRLLARSPVFACVSILSLALAIGGNSTIFSLINAVALRPLTIPNPEELYTADVVRPGDDETEIFSYLVAERTRELLAGRAEVCAQSSQQSMQVARRAPDGTATLPEPAQVQLVSGHCFPLLRQQAQAGRLLGPDDSRTLGQHPVAVISDAYWSRRFGRAPSAVGSEVVINGTAMTIVGVAGQGFFGTTVGTVAPDVWAPLMMQAEVRYARNAASNGGDSAKPWPPQREIEWLNVMLRVPAGGAAAATEALNLALQRESALAAGYQGNAERLRRLRESRVSLLPGSRGFSPLRREITPLLLVLLGMVGLLLALASANIAGVLIARGASRRREVAIRLSVGASRRRVVRQLLTESLLLAVAGGALGLLFAAWSSTPLLAFINRGGAVTGIAVTPDWRVMALTFAVSAATGLLFGLLPALRTTRIALAETLKAQLRLGAGSAMSLRRLSPGALLVSAQMAFCVLLLIVAALFARTLQETLRVDVGFDARGLLVARIDPRAASYRPEELPALYRRVMERVAGLPGVTSVSVSANGPFSGSSTIGGFEAEGYTHPPDVRLRTWQERVTADYFRTVGLRITRGRAFRPEDSRDGRRVSIVNETFARRHFAGQDPIAKRWGYGSDFAESGFEIVGVVEDARYNDLKSADINMVYLPADQTDRYLQSLEVRVAGDPATLGPAIRNALREAEPRLPVGGIEALEGRLGRAAAVERLLAVLTTGFGGMALCLACLGLYGTISYAVSRRTAELGVRMALGAGRGTVRWMILREALTLVVAGLVIGLPLAFFAGRAVRHLLYGVTPSDLTAYAAAVATLIVVATLAVYVPARRASRLEPMAALRSE